ncbi:tautomerase family protein [Frankia sp. CiP1_Cm_nod2]|uniref:tautomerase family protein n=1 Tax=Frankia sp. CiP1_Cm_nod2 TaxID=2897161 RepID=UPI00202542EC
MPLWRIDHTEGIFTDEDKARLAESVTDHYARFGLPRFYVVVLFSETSASSFYVGGEPGTPAVRVSIDHIARTSPDEAARQRTAAWIGRILGPFMARIPGAHWEFHADETSRDLWLINGLVPPPEGSEAEQEWARSNLPSVY